MWFHNHWADRLLFYIILVFVSITTASWPRTTTTYVSVHEYTFVRAVPAKFIVPADVYSQAFGFKAARHPATGSFFHAMDVDIEAIAGPSLSYVTTRQNSSRPYPGHNSPPPKLNTPTDVTSGPATPNQAVAGPSSMIRSSDGTPVSILDAMCYLYAIRDQFPDKPEVYNRFLDIIRDCKNELCVVVLSELGILAHLIPSASIFLAQ